MSDGVLVMMSPHLAWRSADLWRARFLRQSASLFSRSVDETGRYQNLEEERSRNRKCPPRLKPAPSKTNNNKETVKHLSQEIKAGNSRPQGLIDIVSASALRLSSCFNYCATARKNIVSWLSATCSQNCGAVSASGGAEDRKDVALVKTTDGFRARKDFVTPRATKAKGARGNRGDPAAAEEPRSLRLTCKKYKQPRTSCICEKTLFSKQNDGCGRAKTDAH